MLKLTSKIKPCRVCGYQPLYKTRLLKSGVRLHYFKCPCCYDRQNEPSNAYMIAIKGWNKLNE